MRSSLYYLDQYAYLDLYSASSLKQQSAVRHVAPLGHIILIPSQPVLAISPLCCMLSGEATNTNFIVFGLTPLNPRSTAIEASTLTITPQMYKSRYLYMTLLMLYDHMTYLMTSCVNTVFIDCSYKTGYLSMISLISMGLGTLPNISLALSSVT